MPDRRHASARDAQSGDVAPDGLESLLQVRTAIGLKEVPIRRRGAFPEHFQSGVDAGAADDQDAALLRVPRGTPILRLTHTSRDAEGRIFEASEDRYLSEVVRFTVAASGISTDGHYMRAVGG